ncbi:MAG: NFACT RNA binding domain-containing protein [Fibrobacterota bacterium]
METIQEQLRLRHRELRSRLKRKKRTLKKQIQERDEASRWEQFRQLGDTLLAEKNSVTKGMKHYPTQNIHTQKDADIPLNPKLTAAQNAKLLYKKARKGQRSYALCCDKADSTQKEIAELEAYCTEAAELREAEASEEEVLPFLKKTNHLKNNSAPTSQKNTEKALPYRHYEYRGWNIYAGKTATMNDELSTRFAKPSDIWLHAVGYAGSHVIIRRKKNTPWPPVEIIDFAGGIAVFFSKAKYTSYAEVHITEARFVRKPRKSPPGLVQAQRCKTKRVAPVDPQKTFQT